MKKALISVANKANLNIILEKLSLDNYEFISTGTTAKEIEKLGYNVTKVSDIINFEEILGGRVKTLHPNIHGGILSRRTDEDKKELEKYNISEIDTVVCNLYPFEEVTSKEDVKFIDAIENIDIGGVTLIRAAAKNHEYVTILCDPNDYSTFDKDNKVEYAIKAFEHTAYYDIIISKYLKKAKNIETDTLLLAAQNKDTLRYGENSHQQAAYYTTNKIDYSIANSEILHGKQLSYNNIKDIDAALNLISEFNIPAAVALKHNQPCGVGFDNTSLSSAFDKCYEMDSLSIFGGIVAFNQKLTLDICEKLSKIFLEVIIAPDFDHEALDLLKKKKNLRILQTKMDTKPQVEEITSINGGILWQTKDQNNILEEEAQDVTVNKMDETTLHMAKMAQLVCKYVKSNAIVVANKDGIISQGGGQTSRVDAAKIALERAKQKGYTENLILASDAFFPFTDAVELAHFYGVKYIIQPGGSIKDEEVIKRADELEIAMVISKIRHFKH